MNKKNALLLIPLLIIAVLIIYCWTTILTTDALATWRHYIGLIFFLGLVFFYFRNYQVTLAGTGIYLLLATINVLSFKVIIKTSWLRIGPVETPALQMLSLGILLLFMILNFNQLINLYLDFEEKIKKEK